MTGPSGPDRAGGTAATRPWSLWLALVMVGAEALALLGGAVAFVVLAFATAAVSTSLLALAAMFVILAAGLAGVVSGLFRMARWARPAAVAWQVLLILFGLSTLGADPLMAAAAMAPAVLGLIGIFAPPTLRAYEAAGEQPARDDSAGDHPAGERSPGDDSAGDHSR